MFSKLGVFFWKTQGFSKNSNFYCLEQGVCHIPADHDCWLKENEQDGVDDQNGFICFLFDFVPFTWNEHKASVNSCDIREL